MCTKKWVQQSQDLICIGYYDNKKDLILFVIENYHNYLGVFRLICTLPPSCLTLANLINRILIFLAVGNNKAVELNI